MARIYTVTGNPDHDSLSDKQVDSSTAKFTAPTRHQNLVCFSPDHRLRISRRIVMTRSGHCIPFGGIMTTRRTFLAEAGVLVTGATAARAQDFCAVFTKDTQSVITPDQAVARLKDGNARFLAGQTIHCDLLAQVRGTASGQAPFAAVLGCMDSRVPPELVFDQRIGDIFAVRIAGNFVNTDIVGSLEYATKVAGAKLIVVLGHTDCGAVKGAIDNVDLGVLTAALANIRPSMLKIVKADGDRNSKNKGFVQSVADQNAKDAASMLTTRSGVLAELGKERKLKIVAAMHDVSTGGVTWFA
jgi:carbonic anhydrase